MGSETYHEIEISQSASWIFAAITVIHNNRFSIIFKSFRKLQVASINYGLWASYETIGFQGFYLNENERKRCNKSSYEKTWKFALWWTVTKKCFSFCKSYLQAGRHLAELGMSLFFSNSCFFKKRLVKMVAHWARNLFERLWIHIYNSQRNLFRLFSIVTDFGIKVT